MRTSPRIAGMLSAAAVALALTAVPATSPFLPSAAAQDAEKSKTPPLVMSIEGTPLLVTLDLPGFANNNLTLEKLRDSHGSRVLAAGSGAGGVVLTVITERSDGAALSSADWRKKLHTDTDDTEQFEHGDIACVDDSRTKASLQEADYHAYAVAAGLCFDIHASQLGDPEDDGFFTKRKFRALVDTFRLCAFRRGGFSDYSPEVVDGFHAVASKFPEWKAAADAAVAAKPEDWAAAFIAAEAANAFGAPEPERAAAYERAAELLAKAKPAEATGKTAWAAVEEALGLADHAAGKFKLAVVHLKLASDLAAAATPALKGAVHYSFARSLTKAVAPAKESIAALKIALECAPQRREEASKDPDFASIRSRAEFRALVAPPK